MNAAKSQIRLFVMDVDGTLTDGTITYTAEGVEIKSFHARDGAGIRLLPLADVVPAIVSGRASEATQRRARELGIQHVYEASTDKVADVDAIREELGLDWDAVAFIGDDLSDIPPMRRAGFSAAPADAAPEVRRVAGFVASLPGGRGAVREAIETLLRSQGSWEGILARLDAEPPA